MNIVTVRCDHTSARLTLEIAEEDIRYIQCQLIQIRLTPEQTKSVTDHCACMARGMWFDTDGGGGACMTIDPSQLRLEKEFVTTSLVG
jgi:hypothetical protein